MYSLFLDGLTMKSGLFLLGALLVGTASAFVVTPYHGVAVSGTTLGSTKARNNNNNKKIGGDQLEGIEEKFLFNGFENFEKENFDDVRKLPTPPARGADTVIDKGEAAEAETLSDVITNQLLGSSMIYTFAKVREFVRTNRKKYNWYRPELILPEKESPGANVSFDAGNTGFSGLTTTYQRYLKYPIRAKGVLEFVSNENNKAILSAIDPTDFNVDNKDDFDVLATLKRLSDIDGDIVEFDDQFSHKELVYALTVNRSRKRITVCFRGSVLGGRDWLTNVNCFLKSIDTPRVLKDMELKTKIQVHRGFDGYLFEKTADGNSKFDDILGQIREVYRNEKYADYALYVCGHSLGGALTSLLAFYLAASGKLQDVLNKDRPITAISFASPQVGDNGYNKAFQALESMRDLLHVRISNQGDIVPVSPSFFGYTQTGVNLHLHSDKDMEVSYRNLKGIISQLGLNPVDNHSLKTYYTRLSENRETLDKFKTFHDLYDEGAGDFTN